MGWIVTCCLIDGGEWWKGRRGKGQVQTFVRSEIRMRGIVYDWEWNLVERYAWMTKTVVAVGETVICGHMA